MALPANFKVEIYFNPNSENLEDICNATDEIFSSYEIPCIISENDNRIYMYNDCGLLAAAIGKVKRNPRILSSISDGIFDWGDKRETLMTNFFKH